jgi:acyl-CoA synthetase (NDP forming)
MNLERIFKPRSVAVFGVSSTKMSGTSNVIFKKLKSRYPVQAFAVNPRGGEVQGEPLYKTIGDIPVTVDLAVISVQAEHVPGIIEACIAHQVGGAVLVSAGFTEVGQTDLQDRLVALARAADFPIIGPNCLGIFSAGHVDTLFVPPERMVQPVQGSVAMVSQSGAFMVDQLVKFATAGVGVSHMVSIGNKAVVREIDLLKYLADDPATDVITFYLEGFDKNEGREFVTLARDCQKPVLIFKAGKSAEGSRAVGSHTASIAGDYKVSSDVFRQYGLIEVKSEYELLSFCKALSIYRRSIGPNIGIITVSGGHGAIATDLCIEKGMRVPPIPAETQQLIRGKLSKGIQGLATLTNPADLTASAQEDDFVTVYNELCKLPDYDAFLMLVLPYGATVETTIGARMANPAQKRIKPLVAYTPNVEKYRMMIDGFEANSVPVADSIEGAVMMLDGLRRYKGW